MYQRSLGTTNLLWSFVFLIFAIVAGCKAPSSQPAPGQVQSQNLPEAPTRIVSLAPNVTEILFAVGAGPQVVGVTRYCDFPKQVSVLPKIGGLVDPDAEAIVALQPDLVIGVTSAGDPAITKTLERAKIPFLFVRMESMDETLRGIRTIAHAAAKGSQGDALVADLTASLAPVGAPDDPARPSVLMVFGHKPIVAAGPGTFAHDLLTRAGGNNVLQNSSQPWPSLDAEQVLKLNPDRILDLSMVEESPDDGFWESMPALEAVESHNVYRFVDPAMMRPGPRMVEAYQRIALAIRGKRHVH